MKEQFVTETIFLSERWRNERQTEAVGQKMPRKGTSLRLSPIKYKQSYHLAMFFVLFEVSFTKTFTLS